MWEAGTRFNEEPKTTFSKKLSVAARFGFNFAKHSSSMNQHILVVDDEAQIRELLSVYLRRQGYKVTVAANGAETMAALGQSPVGLVVLDIGLEHEDGLGLLERIKAAHPKVRVVMLTGMGFVEDLLEEALAKGADDYVSKVLALDELHMAIQRVFKQNPPRESAA